MSKLAIHGGTSIVPIHLQSFQHPLIDIDIFEQMKNLSFQNKIVAFDSDIITQLQDKLKEMLELKHTLVTNSGTSALFEMYYAAGLEPGDEIIVPCYTFFATATPLFILKCIPVLADCKEDGNIDPLDIEKKITSRTKAICVTHMWGIPCDMDSILKIAQKYNLLVFEDSSHAHGAVYNKKYAGTFGIASAWSLGTKKLLTGGQGGFLGTNDEKIYEKAILVGHANNKRIREITIPDFESFAVTGTGMNLRMHPFSAAVLLHQIDIFPKQLEERRLVASYLAKEVNSLPGLKALVVPKYVYPSWYAFPILYDSSAFEGVSKEVFVNALISEGALEADIPHSTCPLTTFDVFRKGGVNFEQQKLLNEIYCEDDFPHAKNFQYSMFKIPTWYGPLHLEYAKAYIRAIHKVVENINELKQ